MSQSEQRGDFCPQCGSDISGANYCPDCGHQIDSRTRTEVQAEPNSAESSEYVSVLGRQFHRSEYMMILGGLLAIVGSFLPWYSPSALVTHSGIDIGAVGYFPIIVGAVVLSPLVLDDEDWSLRNMLAGAGLALVGLAFILSSNLPMNEQQIGLLLTEVGLVVIALAPGVKYYYRRQKQVSSGEPTA
ncbi:zinc ribbon domain-containing protein [Halorientalis salina]|uniref:zinc ribbon domain-containing protein n=1 Tax=Halorientalis salina TaxID=2932266 RepID=UPI0010ABC6EC|nr:zinc ribbon domain-containing protein [Halorientalis salina]